MPRKLPNDLRLRIPENKVTSEKSQNPIELSPRPPPPPPRPPPPPPPPPEIKTPPALVKSPEKQESNSPRTAPLHMKTRAHLKCPVNDCSQPSKMNDA